MVTGYRVPFIARGTEGERFENRDRVACHHFEPRA